MKLCVCGKGGSGKSTVVSLLAVGFRQQGREVVVLDSDESNTSLYWMLGCAAPPRPLLELAGGRKRVQQGMLQRFSKGEDEPRMSIWEMETITSRSIPPDYVVQQDGIRLVATGKIHQALEGCACAMGTVSREFLKLFRTLDSEVLLADMEAGIEHFGRGIESGVDGVIAVVEPSLESISLAHKVMELSLASGAAFWGTVLNKVASPEQGRQLREQLTEREVPMLGVITFHPALQSACLRGRPVTGSMCPELGEIRDALTAIASGAKR